MNKKGLIILIVFLSAVCVLMTSGFIYLLANNFVWGSLDFDYEGKLIDSIEYENDATSLNVDTKSIDVYFEETAGDKISLEIYSNNKKIDYSFNNENGVITLKAYNKINGSIFIGFGAYGKVVVKLPKENKIEEFRIDQKVGDIRIGSFENLNGTINNSVGDLRIDALNNAKIDLSTGDIKIKKINKVEIKHSTGDLDIDSVSELINNSSTGDIEIDNVDYKFEITSKTGDIKIRKVTGVYVEATTNVGDTKINNNDRYLEKTLTIKNKTGDIRIN